MMVCVSSGHGALAISTVPTSPFPGGQKPGTSGLRATTKTFQQPRFLTNFLQAIFASLDDRPVRTGVTWGKAQEPKGVGPRRRVYKSRDRVRTRGAYDGAPQPPEAFERLA